MLKQETIYWSVCRLEPPVVPVDPWVAVVSVVRVVLFVVGSQEVKNKHLRQVEKTEFGNNVSVCWTV